MKICFASQSFYPHIGGVPTYLLNLISELQRMGNEVLEIHLRTPKEELEDEVKDIQVYRVPKEPLTQKLLEGYSRFKETFMKTVLGQSDTFKGNVFEMDGYKEFCDINHVFGEELHELFKDHPAEIVHVHDFQLILLYKYVPRGIPLILTWHVPFTNEMNENVKKFIIEHMIGYDKVIFSSREYLEAAVRAGLPKGKGMVIYPISNLNLFRVRDINKEAIKKKFSIPKESAVILCVQRIDWRSSHKPLVKAMPYISKKVPHAVLVFVGEKSLSSKISKCRDKYKEDVIDLVKKLGVVDKVIFAGNIDYSVLPELYNVSDVVAAVPEMEGFGLSITEAMLCGKPIVGTNVGGIPLQIKHGKNGFLVEPGDIKSIAEKISKILLDEKLKEKMSAASLEIVKKFSPRRGVEQHVILYQNLLKEKSDLWRLEMIELDNIKAIITDFDRTLTEKLGVIRTKVIKKLKSAKKPLLLVTGRKLNYVKKFCDKYNIWISVIAENGSVVYSPKTQKVIITDSEYMKIARNLAKRSGLKVFIGKVIISSKIENEKELKEILKPVRRRLHFERNVDEIMVMPKGVDKSKGVFLALKELEIDPEKTIIFGDAENDVPLFKVPGYRVAVANASKRLKTIADEITENPSGDGIIEAIEKLKR